MKKSIYIFCVLLIGVCSYAQADLNIYDQMQKEVDNLLIISSRIFNLSHESGETTLDSPRLKAAGIEVSRYVFDIQNITSLYKAYEEITDDHDKAIIKNLINTNLKILSLRLIGEKVKLLGNPKLIDPLEFDSFQARKEVSTAMDELEKLGNRLENLSKKLMEK